jgi:hypothetical protein
MGDALRILRRKAAAKPVIMAFSRQNMWGLETIPVVRAFIPT